MMDAVSEREIAEKFNSDDYLLSFSVEGVNIFVTDIHRDVYIDLEVLFIIDHGLFKQYFTKRAFARALENGVKFYSDKISFDHFQDGLDDHCRKFKIFFESEIKSRDSISSATVQQFFDYTIKLCKEYTKMNFEYTDKAFTLKDENRIIEDNLRRVSKLKDEIRAFMNIVLFEEKGYASQVFRILSDQFSINRVILENLTQKELLGLFYGKMPHEEAVLQRQEIFITVYDNVQPYEGETARAIARRFEDKPMNENKITGQMASKGKAFGTVKIIHIDYGNISRMNHEINEMRQGEILVAKTTAPELIIACQKARAIVTDMGGLLSHAAIVSREFGIPCIVGTNNATQILGDGDVVEVDADNGIVTVLRKFHHS